LRAKSGGQGHRGIVKAEVGRLPSGNFGFVFYSHDCVSERERRGETRASILIAEGYSLAVDSCPVDYQPNFVIVSKVGLLAFRVSLSSSSHV